MSYLHRVSTVLQEGIARTANSRGLAGGGALFDPVNFTTQAALFEGRRRILYQNTCDRRQRWTTPHCDDQATPRLVVQYLTFASGDATGERLIMTDSTDYPDPDSQAADVAAGYDDPDANPDVDSALSESLQRTVTGVPASDEPETSAEADERAAVEDDDTPA